MKQQTPGVSGGAALCFLTLTCINPSTHTPSGKDFATCCAGLFSLWVAVRAHVRERGVLCGATPLFFHYLPLLHPFGVFVSAKPREEKSDTCASPSTCHARTIPSRLAMPHPCCPPCPLSPLFLVTHHTVVLCMCALRGVFAAPCGPYSLCDKKNDSRLSPLLLLRSTHTHSGCGPPRAPPFATLLLSRMCRLGGGVGGRRPCAEDHVSSSNTPHTHFHPCHNKRFVPLHGIKRQCCDLFFMSLLT